MCSCSFNVSFFTEPPQDLDLQMRTKTRPRLKKKKNKSPHYNTEVNSVLNCSSTLLYILFFLHCGLTCRSYSSTSFEDAVKKVEEPPTPPPRPQKTHSRASSLDLNKLFQQGAPGTIHMYGLCLPSLSCFHNISFPTHTLRAQTAWNYSWVIVQLSYCVLFVIIVLSWENKRGNR